MRGCAEAAPRSLVVTLAARELRRVLSPTAWLVLEELLFGAEAGVAVVSVRQLGRTLGLARDTAARGLRELRAAGLVVATQRRAHTAVLETAHYRISVPAGLTIVATPRSRVATEPAAQLSFAIEP